MLMSIVTHPHRVMRHRVMRHVALLLGLGVLLLGGAPPIARSAPSPASAVTTVTFTARSDGAGYVVRVRTSSSIRAYSMPHRVDDQTLEWTLYNARLAPNYQAMPPKGPVQAYTPTMRNGHLVLRFRLDPSAGVKASAYRDGASDDVLLNLAYTSGAPARPAQTAASARAAPPPARTASAVDGRGASQKARERWRLDTVVIDAGHGGKDPGATANGLREKDLVLKVAKKLGGYLENLLDLNVVYTRTDDRFIELEERGHIANRAGAKLFISLHINAARSRSAHGTETFFLGQHKTEAARKVMERENSVIRYEDNPEDYDEYNEDALVRQMLTQSAYMRQSQQLAGLIEDQFANRVHRHSRGVHQAGFYVLWSASMPSVLVELGFLTNPAEARFLNSEQGQDYLASAVFRAIRDYKAQYEKGIERVASE
jgi:N-acetylmuramoyl-L-alanine amidase